MITSWRIVCSYILVMVGALLGVYETVFGQRDPAVYFFCTGAWSLALGLKVDNVLNKDETHVKPD